MGNPQVSGGTPGDTTYDKYVGTETGEAQVDGWSHVEVQHAVSLDRIGIWLSLEVKSNGGRGVQVG